MVNMSVVYDGELRCTAMHAPSKSAIETDAPADNHGKAQRFSPTDLVGVALGTCIATTLGIVGDPKGWPLKGLRIEVGKEMNAEGPRRIDQLKVEVWMPAKLDGAARAEVERIVTSNPVLRSLHPDIRVTSAIHWPT